MKLTTNTLFIMCVAYVIGDFIGDIKINHRLAALEHATVTICNITQEHIGYPTYGNMQGVGDVVIHFNTVTNITVPILLGQ